MRTLARILAALVAAASLLACSSGPAPVASATPPRAPSAAPARPQWSAMERLTVELSFISLAGCWETEPAKVSGAVRSLMAEMLPRQELVWGPALHQPRPELLDADSRRSDALAFISRDLDSGDYFVVFRGTNTVSATEWILQDFLVQKQVPWSELSPGTAAGPDALVSEGTARAVQLRLALRPDEGEAGAGSCLEEALFGIVARAKGRAVLHFAGHSLGGLLAPTMALWLVDRLDCSGLAELRASKLGLDVYGYAAPTAGNQAFASYLASRLPQNRRYANPYDIAPLAWSEGTMASLPSLYAPEIAMSPLTKSFFELCRGLAREKGYAHPGSCVPVPSRTVPARGDLFLLEAAYQHSFPYLDMLKAERRDAIVREVLDPLAEMVTAPGYASKDFEDLCSPR